MLHPTLILEVIENASKDFLGSDLTEEEAQAVRDFLQELADDFSVIDLEFDKEEFLVSCKVLPKTEN